MNFRDRLAEVNARWNHPICVGIDPQPSEAGSFLHTEAVRTSPETFLTNYIRTMIDGAYQKAGVLKFQSAFFEKHGLAGIKALESGLKYAKSKEFLCILDAKRGDISTTMTAYGEAAFDTLGADALTVTPYMGWDVFAPLVPWLKKDRGVYTVWLTSNAAAKDIQSVAVGASGRTLTGHIANLISNEARKIGVMSSIGWVAGATRTAELETEIAIFGEPVSLLLPGVGAQGGVIDADLKAILRNNPTSLIPISRGLTSIAERSPKVKTWDHFGSEFASTLASYVAQSR